MCNMGLPKGYYLGKVKFAGKYIFEEGTNRKVSMNYHEFDFPTVKLGARYYELTQYKGYFIPSGEPSHVKPESAVYTDSSRYPGATKEEYEILKAMANYHGIEPPDKSIIQKDTPQQILTEEAERQKEERDDDDNDFRIK